MFLYCIVLAAATLGAIGCGQASDSVTLEGKVTYQGEPLKHGSVTFFPAAGRPVNAGLSTDGSYSIELSPGEYVVAVSYTEPLPAGYREGDPVPPPKFVLPPKYATRARSTLTATVAADQEAPIDFKLE
ncbi:MAG: carboxypeptidase-like regulatory domain-containing protein [Planctomycetes bacterium]|nr:carboxypeptidase-like regulatory domain-containing protein [Planctomycetota bacterium]